MSTPATERARKIIFLFGRCIHYFFLVIFYRQRAVWVAGESTAEFEYETDFDHDGRTDDTVAQFNFEYHRQSLRNYHRQ